MRIIADLHIHSRFSRGCSKDLTIENLEKYARIKGLSLLGTGDFQHPLWNKELSMLEERDGLLFTRTGFPFVMQTEISLIYTQDGSGRRVHLIVYAPGLEAGRQITEMLKSKGRIDYDGRPIFKLSCAEFVEQMSSISKDIEVVPAHIWTPYFGMLGSKSGFDSVKDCFLDKAGKIHALETGLSSDPAMNWRLSQLDRFTLISNSDSHSYWPWRIGREANVLDIGLNYRSLINALRTGEGLVETIEVDPGYGKYHYDGHRACKVCMSPKDALNAKNRCPACGRGLTLGVLHRVEELSDRPEGFTPPGAVPFRRLVPLSEIISAAIGKGVSTKYVWQEYSRLVKGSDEFDVMLSKSNVELTKLTSKGISDYIIKNREGLIDVSPGYDGEYGIPRIKALEEMSSEKKPQRSLGSFL